MHAILISPVCLGGFSCTLKQDAGSTVPSVSATRAASGNVPRYGFVFMGLGASSSARYLMRPYRWISIRGDGSIVAMRASRPSSDPIRRIPARCQNTLIRACPFTLITGAVIVLTAMPACSNRRGLGSISSHPVFNKRLFEWALDVFSRTGSIFLSPMKRDLHPVLCLATHDDKLI